MHLQVDAVEQGSRELGAVAPQLPFVAEALARGVAAVAAGARVLGADEPKAGGESGRSVCPDDPDLPFLERLAQRLEDGAAELG